MKYKFLHSHKSKNCKKWKVIKHDFNNAEEWNKFVNAGFIFIKESKID